MKTCTILILNGPGFADLSAGGDRTGNITVDKIQDQCVERCNELGVGAEFRQTDDRDQLFRWVVRDSGSFDALIVNPGANTTAGVVNPDGYESAIETLAHLDKPVIEVHLTNIFRESPQMIKPLQGPGGQTGLVCGMGLYSYLLGIEAIAARLRN